MTDVLKFYDFFGNEYDAKPTTLDKIIVILEEDFENQIDTLRGMSLMFGKKLKYLVASEHFISPIVFRSMREAVLFTFKVSYPVESRNDLWN
ncbi:hypothetical protein PP742_gp03 [Alcaligenes phage vB_Af_QDWS595]|uniref:Uncharacterized protein n=1 Tax=Alcaligenes phage vB_Af_QDWS595 TaxID=2877946 RepID=A0AAE8Y1H1_9CAUD|nr:hypothetical protein PP742_gp03 [Alcaligenes phage vB_Af_QDWS595]UCR75561.1 hypothetical protein vBAfaPQDWS595_03 [Alcaligenes phage vB_Af_QDWS595]